MATAPLTTFGSSVNADEAKKSIKKLQKILDTAGKKQVKFAKGGLVKTPSGSKILNAGDTLTIKTSKPIVLDMPPPEPISDTETPPGKKPAIDAKLSGMSKNKLAAKDPNDAPDMYGKFTSPLGEAWLKYSTSFSLLYHSKGFYHPVSKQWFPTKKGDFILQHKLTPESFAVLDAQGNKKFQINKNGKKFKWSPHIPKSNYKVILVVTQDADNSEEEAVDGAAYVLNNEFTHPVSKTSVTLAEGETLMQHNFTPNSYLVLSPDGSMKYKIDAKGKVQKAGTNLKPSNYHSIMTGTPPKEAKGFDDHHPVFHLMSKDEVEIFLSTELEPGDFLDSSKGKIVKLDSGEFQYPGGLVATVNSVKMLPNTDPPVGAKNEHGVPLNKIELVAWLSKLPDGHIVSSGKNFSAKKKSHYFDVHYKDDHWPSMYFPTLGTLIKTMDKFTKLNLKAEAPPKPAKNDHGFPAHGSIGEMVGVLGILPKGAKIYSPKFDWVAVKGDVAWTIPSGDVWASAFLANIMSTWAAEIKDDLQVDSGAPEVNKGGVPTYDEKAFVKWAKDLPIGTVVGIQTIVPGAKKPATATKTGTDEWTDDASAKEIDTASFAKVIVANKNGKVDEFEVKSYPPPPTKTKATKKSKVTDNVVGTPTIELANETEFNIYYKKGMPNSLNTAISGVSDNVVTGWYQADLFNYVSGYGYDVKLAALAKDKFGKAISDAIANIEYAKKNAGLAPSTKAKATKTVKKLNELFKYHQAAKKLSAGELPEQHPVDPTFVWGNTATWAFDMNYSIATLQKYYDEVKFKTESASLGWDPFDGTHEQYKDYLATTEASSWAPYLNHTQAKEVALHYMKAPGHTLGHYSLQKYEKAVKKGQFAEKVSEALKEKNGQPFKPGFITQDKEFPSAPSFMDSQEWEKIKFLLSGESDLKFPDQSKATPASLEERFGHLGSIIPPEAANLLGGYFSYVDESNARFIQTVSYLLKSGIWNEDAMTYEDLLCGKIALTPGMKVCKYTSNTYFIPKDFDGGYVAYMSYEGLLGRTYVHQNDVLNYFTLLYTAPFKVTLKDAQSDGHNFDAASWKTVETLEDTVEPDTSFTGLQILDIKNALGPSSSIKVSELSDKAKSFILTLPKHADIIVYKDQKGHYRADTDVSGGSSEPTTEWEAVLLKPDVPASLKEVSHLTDPDEIQETLDCNYSSSLLAFAYEWLTGNEWDDSGNYDYPEEALRDEITHLQATQLAKKVDSPDAAKFGTLYPLPNQDLGGGRPKKYYVNADGELYMAKPENKDKFRVDTEYAAVEIGHMFGFNTPAADIREIDGDYSYVQYVAPADQSLFGIAPAALSDKQLIDVMSGHVLDWAISQHDTHGAHILLQPDGQALKIDLGQAFKFLGSDKLAVGYQPPGNPDPVWYDKFYNKVRLGVFDKELLDKVTKAVLTKARRVAMTKDKLYERSLELAFASRKTFPTGYDRESYTALAMERKHQTFGDFLNFYSKLYSDGGYDFDFTEDEFNQTTLAGSAAHLSPTPQFAEQIKFAKAHGKSLFFASPEIEDAHALLYTSQAKKGSTTLRGDLKIRTDGDAAIKAWISAQGVSVASSISTPAQASYDLGSGASQAADVLVAFAKTVSVHQEDGQYNPTTVSQALSVKAGIEEKLSTIQENWVKNPLFRHPDFETGHQQWAWVGWAEHAIASFDAVHEAMQTSKKSPMVDASVSYTPPGGIEVTKDIKAIETVEANGVIYTKYNDFTFTDPERQIDSTDYEAFKGLKGAVTTNLSTKEESKQIVATPKYSVVKTIFKTPRFEAIAEDGTLVEKGVQEFYPDAYDITSSEHPDIAFHYFTHQDSPHDTTNQGRLQISVKDWDGDSSAIDRALGMLNDMGIDTSPADETSLELFYWRHLAGILRQRKLDAQAQKTKTAMDDLEAKLATMSADEEIAARKKVLAGLWGEDAVENADWRPKIGSIISHMQPADAEEDFDATAGRPHWVRPDFNIADVKKWSGGILPSRTDGHGLGYLMSGAYTSSEEKIRYRGWFGHGHGANSPESDREQGSGQFGFLRQGQYLSSTYSGSVGIYVEPWVLGRTQNYAFNSDHYGNIETRKKASPFDIKGSISLGSKGGNYSSNELMFKYGLSTWDDVALIQVHSQSARSELVEKFKKMGFNLVRGIAIEERIVTSKAEAQTAMEKIWAQAEKDQSDG